MSQRKERFEWQKDYPYEDETKGLCLVHGYAMAYTAQEVADMHKIDIKSVQHCPTLPQTVGVINGGHALTFAVIDGRWPLVTNGIFNTRLVLATSVADAIDYYLGLNLQDFFPTNAYLVVG